MTNSELQQVKMRFGIIGNAEGLNRAIDIAIQVAKTDLSVLITGESGVGKENFPKIIHQYSARKHGAYVAVNCGAIPEGTIDSELFGHEKGAFTGAIGERKGYFGEADGGTIFLDEVGELPMSTQARLLRVLESGEFMRVGSSKVEKTNVRVVAATNVNLPQAISEGRFREDLFYRLNTVPIKIPALRDRGDDVLLLFRKFASDFAATYNMPNIRLTEDAQTALKTYNWPGNVRQLKNVTEQISLIETNRDINAETLSAYLPKQEVNSMMPVLLGDRHDGKTFNSEREILYQVLWDMRRDMEELKHAMKDIMASKNISEQVVSPISYPQQSVHNIINDGQQHPVSSINISPVKVQDINKAAYAEPEEYVETTLSLNEVEKDMIVKALEKNRGKRKAAAKDLNISERTLYRKIKEYDINI